MHESLPILYSFRRCPYAMRARLALAVSEQAVELREVVLRNRPDELRAVSPKATVPVLILPDGSVLEESLEIMHWTLGNRDPKGWLPTEESSAEADALIARNDGDFKFHLDRTKYADRYEDVDPEEHRELASVILRDLEKRLSKSRYLLGSGLSLPDMAIAPFVRQFAFADREWFDAQSWDHLRAWLDEFVASEALARIMIKREAWQAGDEPVVVSWQG